MWPAAYAINVDARGFAPVPWDRLIVWPGINVLTAVLAALLRRRLDGPSTVRDPAAALGSYRLISPIGEGGMGEVWKASHDMLARRAAIKLVRPNAGAFTKQPTVWVERFRREANVIASLQSPHTIYLYDFGLSGDGQFYYVMELVDGISLQTLVDDVRPATGRAGALDPDPDLLVARGSARARRDSPRFEAVKHDDLPARPEP